MQNNNEMKDTLNEQEVQKKNGMLLILLIGLVVLIGGAYLLYAGLSDKVEHNQLSSQADGADGANSQADGVGVSDDEDSAAANSDTEKQAAPDITFYDPDGNEVKLSDFQGKPVILNFWASWCGPCKSEMPDFNMAYLKYGAQIHFLMVNMTDGYSETQASGQELIDEQGYVFPVYFDLEQDAAMTYAVTSIPTTYFLDAEGNFVAQARGALDASALQTGIDMLLD